MKPNWKDYLKSFLQLFIGLGQVLLVFGILVLTIFLITKYTVIVPLLCVLAVSVLLWDDLAREFKSTALMYAEERHEKENPSDEA